MKSKLNLITDYLLSKNNFFELRYYDIKSLFKNVKSQKGGHNETEKGWHISNFSYSGIIHIGTFPKKYITYLLIMIEAWLDDNDDTRSRYKLKSPSYEYIEESQTHMSIEITIGFIDEIFIGESEGGPIDWNGKNYDIESYELFTATELNKIEKSWRLE